MNLLRHDYYITARVVLRKVLSGCLLVFLGGNLGGLFRYFQFGIRLRYHGTRLKRVVLDYLDRLLVVGLVFDVGLGSLLGPMLLLLEWNLPEHALFKQRVLRLVHTFILHKLRTAQVFLPFALQIELFGQLEGLLG